MTAVVKEFSRIIIDVTDTLVIDYDARKWCCLPYPGHRVMTGGGPLRWMNGHAASG